MTKRQTGDQWIDDDDATGVALPFVYFKLHDTDTGNEPSSDRVIRDEYLRRSPHCAIAGDLSGVMLQVSNSGLTMSDVVIVEYRVIFCTLEQHGPSDGFRTSHAAEAEQLTADAFHTANVVPPLSSVTISLSFPEFRSRALLRNVYVQARVGTIWDESVEADLWSFADDPKVTEWHLPVRQRSAALSRTWTPHYMRK